MKRKAPIMFSNMDKSGTIFAVSVLALMAWGVLTEPSRQSARETQEALRELKFSIDDFKEEQRCARHPSSIICAERREADRQLEQLLQETTRDVR